MRKLMWFALGYGAAMGLGVYFLPLGALIPLGVVALALALGYLLRGKRDRLRPLGPLLLGLALGFLWYFGYDRVRLEPVRQLDGQTREVTLTAWDYGWQTEYGSCVDARGELEGRTVRVRVYLNQSEPPEPGDQILGAFRLRYTAPGAQKGATFHSGSGILLLAYPQEDARVEAGEDRPVFFVAHLRRQLEGLLEELFAGDTLPFALALLLGDTSRLDYGTETALSLSGLRHVAAVSGLHVSILFSLVYFFTRRTRRASLLLGLPALALFAALAGFSPSIVRSALMQLLMLLAMALDRDYDPPTALGFAVVTLLTVNPLGVTSVGLQMSVASVAGILLFSQRVNRWLLEKAGIGTQGSGEPEKGKRKRHRLLRAGAASLSVSLGALIGTTPLSAAYFGTVNLIGLGVNLLCLWAVTFLFCGILLACLLGAVWLPAGRALGWFFDWVVRYVLGVARVAARFPLAALHTASPYAVAWLVFAYGLLALFLWGKKRRARVLLCCAGVGLCMAVCLSWLEPRLEDYRVTALDVGQGQCVVLQSQGRTFLVDCGGDYDRDAADIAAGYLLSMGITRVDGLIVSHYDRDHAGGVEYLLQRIGARVLVLPKSPGATLMEPGILAHHTGQTVWCQEDLSFAWGDTGLRVFASQELKNANESSLCVLFQKGKCDILITGDRGQKGERLLLATGAVPEVDILVVGHHGAAGSTGEELLEAVRPALALISVGADNSYGHPTQAVLDRLAQIGCRVRRTDLEGTIIIRG